MITSIHHSNINPSWGYKMHRGISITLGFSLALMLFAIGTTGVTIAADPEDKMVEGELVDLRCFMTRGAQGEAHQACGASCAKRGLPIGVIDAKGNAYTILASSPAYADYINRPVRITGKVTNMMLSPTKLEVKDGDQWKAVKLIKEMM